MTFGADTENSIRRIKQDCQLEISDLPRGNTDTDVDTGGPPIDTVDNPSPTIIVVIIVASLAFVALVVRYHKDIVKFFQKLFAS
jgi:hypothetical protein